MTDAEAVAALSRQNQRERVKEKPTETKPEAKPVKTEAEEVEVGEQPKDATEESGDKSEPTEVGEELAEAYEFSELAEALGMDEATLMKRLALKNKDGSAVTLEDLQKGHLRDADYRRKTMQHAEREREFETRVQQTTAQLQQAQQTMGALTQMLVQTLQLDGQNLQAMLNDEYVDEKVYRKAEVEVQRKRNLLAAILQQQQGAQAQGQEQQKRQVAEHNVKQEELLTSLLPDLKDPVKRKAFEGNIYSFLEAENFTRQEIGAYFSGMWDARMVRIAHKARLYDKLQAAKTAEKLKDKPPVSLKSGSSTQTSREAKLQGLAQLRGNLVKAARLGRKQGDAAALKLLRAEIGQPK